MFETGSMTDHKILHKLHMYLLSLMMYSGIWYMQRFIPLINVSEHFFQMWHKLVYLLELLVFLITVTSHERWACQFFDNPTVQWLIQYDIICFQKLHIIGTLQGVLGIYEGNQCKKASILWRQRRFYFDKALRNYHQQHHDHRTLVNVGLIVTFSRCKINKPMTSFTSELSSRNVSIYIAHTYVLSK